MNDLIVFINTEFGKIRIIEIDGRPYAVGVDAARSLGYAKPSQAIIDHCKGIRKLGIPSKNQHGVEVIQETNMIPESDIYRLIIKAADQSRSPDIQEKATRFEQWIFEEVIPSVRKHGAYITASKMEEIMNDPENLVRLLNSLKTENKQLQLRIENDRPKILFADAITTSHCTILVGELAKILKGNGFEIGQNRLFEQLRQSGFLIKRRGADYNSPTQKAMKLGLFSIRETATLHSDGHVSISKTVKVTGKGQLYFVNRFLGKGKLVVDDNQQSFPNFLEERTI
jgi:anti-repressor protein